MWSALPSLAPLAEIPITGEQVQILIYAIIAGIFVGGISCIKALLDIVRYFRGDPPSDQKFASKADLARALAEIEAVEERSNIALAAYRSAVDRNTEEITKSLKEIFGELRTMGRSIGRIEGELGHHSPQSKN